MDPPLNWEEDRLTRLTNESIKRIRQRIREIIKTERRGIYSNNNGKSLRTEFAEELIEELGEYRCMELNHLAQLIGSAIPLDMYEQLILHPLTQYNREKILFIYHFWLKMIEDQGWKDKFKSTIQKHNRNHKIQERITDLSGKTKGELRDKMGRSFQRIYDNRQDDGEPYEDNGLGMLEFAKNLITHCNQCPSAEKVTLEQLEHAITNTFPELALHIFNHCLIHNIKVKDLLIYGIKKEENESQNLSIICDGCDSCYADEDVWEQPKSKKKASRKHK